MGSFSAWKEGAIHYLPTLLVGLFCLYLALRGYRGAWVGVVIFLGYAFCSLFFFRDPPRRIEAAPPDIVSPADGTVVAIEDLTETPYYEGPCRRVSIFLSVLSVHVNRAPFEGKVRDIQYQKGQFMNAMKSASSERNESNAIWLDTARGPITVRQISGAVARRIVCAAHEGQILEKGQKLGMIKLGSRTELYLPLGATICVKLKEKVHAGTSTVARFNETI